MFVESITSEKEVVANLQKLTFGPANQMGSRSSNPNQTIVTNLHN